jgi:hypothetical protein
MACFDWAEVKSPNVVCFYCLHKRQICWSTRPLIFIER